MAETIDYFFALASPWSYIGYQRLLDVARETGSTINYKPVDLATLFPETGGLPLAKRHPSRQAYRLQEIDRWTRRLGREMNPQPVYFPVDDTLAKKVLIVLAKTSPKKMPALVEDLHRVVWVEDLDLSDEQVIRDVLYRHVLPDVEIMLSAKSPAVESELQANTAEAAARGVFGVPSYCLRDQIFWGQDRLDFLQEAIEGK